MRRNRLRWFGHMERGNPESLTRSVDRLKNDGKRPRITWRKAIEKDLQETGMHKEQCHDRIGWRRGIKQSNPERENGL